MRQVTYQADKDGFRATVRTNEPGTKPGEVGGAVFTNDVADIVESTRGILQNTGHVQKQKVRCYIGDSFVDKKQKNISPRRVTYIYN